MNRKFVRLFNLTPLIEKNKQKKSNSIPSNFTEILKI